MMYYTINSTEVVGNLTNAQVFESDSRLIQILRIYQYRYSVPYLRDLVTHFLNWYY